MTAQGVGFAPEGETNPARRERLAAMAAEADAKRHLAQWINGGEVEAVTVVTEGEVATDAIRILVQARVPGSDTVAQSYNAATGQATAQLRARLDNHGAPCPPE